jgi:hypothetical protein
MVAKVCIAVPRLRVAFSCGVKTDILVFVRFRLHVRKQNVANVRKEGTLCNSELLYYRYGGTR